MLRTLLERGVASAVHLGKLAESDSIGLRADFSREGALMGPASALFWRVVCEWLKGEATARGLSAARRVGQAAVIEASKAEEANEALEAALPPTVAELADIIAKHAAAGAAARFACAQLMQLAAKCADFGDAAGRADASLMLRRLLTDAPTCVGERAGWRRSAVWGCWCGPALANDAASSSLATPPGLCVALHLLTPPLPPPAPSPQRRQRRGGGGLGGCLAQRVVAARAGALPAQGVRLAQGAGRRHAAHLRGPVPRRRLCH